MSDPTLSRRAVACPGWRWLAGMRTACGLRVYAIDPRWPLGIREGDQRARPECTALPEDAVPDLDDAATLGAIENGILWPLGWWFECNGELHRPRFRRSWPGSAMYATRAAALVAALEAP